MDTLKWVAKKKYKDTNKNEKKTMFALVYPFSFLIDFALKVALLTLIFYFEDSFCI